MLDELLAPLFSTSGGRRSGLILLGVAVFSLLTVLIYSPYRLYKDWQLTHITPVHESRLPLSTGSKLGQAPVTQPLFGDDSESNTADLPITSLQLHLTGIIEAVPTDLSRAIISEGGALGRVYQLHENITSGVRIEAITPEGITLKHGVRLEVLPLERKTLLFQGKPVSLKGG